MRKVIILSAVACVSIFAEEQIMIDTIVVTGTRTESVLSDVSGSASVITKEQIKTIGVQGAKDTLRSLEGVTVKGSKGIQDTTPLIVLRGMPAQKRTLMLVDGIQLNDSYSAGVSFSSSFLPEDLEQVEVVRGPFSSLYGSNAMGGVINFITAMPKEREFRATFGYGDAFDDGKANKAVTQSYISYGDKLTDKLRLKISYGKTSTDGYKADDATTTSKAAGLTGYINSKTTSNTNTYIAGNKGRSTWDSDNLNIKSEYKINNKDILGMTFTRSWYHYEYAEPESFLKNASGDTVYASGTQKESTFLAGLGDYMQYMWSADWMHRFDIGMIKTTYSASYSDNFYTTPGTNAVRNGGAGTSTPGIRQMSAIDSVLSMPIGDRFFALLGLQYKLQKATSEEYALSNWTNDTSRTSQNSDVGGKERTIAVFGELQSDLTDSLSASVGARYDWWRGYDGYSKNFVKSKFYSFEPSDQFNISPKATLSYKASKSTTFKSSWGRAFRAPDTYVLYKNWISGTPATGIYYFANPNLKPETSESFDFGIEQKSFNNGLFKAYVYRTEIKNLIANKTTTDASLNATVNNRRDQVNVGKALTQGYELSYNQPITSALGSYINYTRTFTKTLENDTAPTTIGKRLTDIPEHSVNFGLTYDDKTLYGSLTGEYRSKVFSTDTNTDVVNGVYGATDLFALFNAKIGYRITKNIDCSLAVSNLFDREYYSYYKAQGRSWFAQISTKF